MKKQSQFSQRMFRPYFYVLALVVTAAMAVLYFASVERIKNNAYDNGQRLAEAVAGQVDAYINELDLLAEQIKVQPEILSLFYELEDSSQSGNYFDNDVLNGIEISSLLKNLLIGRSSTHNIVIYNNAGDVISSQEYLLNKNSKDLIKVNSRYNSMLNAINSSGDRAVQFPEDNFWTDSKNEYITLAKELKNDYSNEVCGIIEVRGLTGALYESIEHSSGENSVISICDRTTGKVMTAWGIEAPDERNRITHSIDGVNWEVVINYKNPLSSTFSIEIMLIILMVYIILLALLFRVTNIIGKSVSKPLVDLTEYVRTIDRAGGSVQPVDDMAIEEIKELADSFDKMLDRVKNSVEQEQRAYSMALQAQMNPHFLYNSLAVIGAAGMENGCDTVTDMCTELSDMLRYVSEYQNITVPLRDEVEHTRHYLALMKSRYEDYFDYTAEIDEELLNMPVPKLFIQPLAENSFKHGFKAKEPPWKINIKMTGSQSAWTLVISDNGTGISGERIAEIKKNISDALESHILDSSVGIGIVNTIVRLKTMHSDNISYDIKNDGGAVITITTVRQ